MNWCDHIATSLSIDREDLELSPFLVAPKPGVGGNQRGKLGNLSAVALAKVEAHQLFGKQLPKLLACPAIAVKRRGNELNEVLAA